MITKRASALRIAIIIALLAIIIAVFNKILVSFNHNEHMYITASYLVSKGYTLYSDFSYVQMPLLPLVYGYIYKITSTTDYLLAGKLISFFFFCGSAYLVYRISDFIIKSNISALAITLAFCLNATIIRVTEESSNYIAPIFFSLLAFYLFTIALDQRRPRLAWMLISGISLSIAIGFKLYYAVATAPFILCALMYPQDMRLSQRVANVAAPFIAGMSIGILPTIYFLAGNFDIFMFNNLGFHNLNHQWRILTEYDNNMSLFEKLEFARKTLYQFDNAIIIFCSLFFLIIPFFQRKDHIFRTIRNLPVSLTLSALLSLVTVIAIFKPTPMFLQYFAMPISFLFLFFISTYTFSRNEASVNTGLLLVPLIILTLAFTLPMLLRDARSNWQTSTIEKISMKIRDSMNENNMPDGKIATLAPVYIIESGLNIYNELATGPFLYRVGDMLTEEQRKRYSGFSQKTLKESFEKDPPAAIFTGYEGKLDIPLREYALSNNYLEVDAKLGSGELYIRPR